MTDQQLINHLQLALSELMAENHELGDYVEQLEDFITQEFLGCEFNQGELH